MTLPFTHAALLQRFAREFMGLDQHDPVATLDGAPAMRRRVYLDTTATALMPRVVWDGLTRYFETACANSHTLAHRAGRDTTAAIEGSRDAIGRLVGYEPGRDVVLFTANGATGATNFLARALFPAELRPVIKRFRRGAPPAFVDALRGALDAPGARVVDELLARPLVVTTCMEHHSNLLPWMEAVGHHNVRAIGVRPDGTLDMDEMRAVLARDGQRVRLVTVTAVSNVTGIINPVREIARLAHAVGAQILVDGAQWVPHGEVRMHAGVPDEALDFLVLSGHKLYAPGSRGALIGRLETLEGKQCVTDVGGGMVEYVAIDDFELKAEVTAREEPGTPNIPGTVAMGLIAETLMAIGMTELSRAEGVLTRQLLRRLEGIAGVEILGESDIERVDRAGVVAFNVTGLNHALVAAYLNDFHNIAVRDGCFCAHPYVKALLQIDAETEARYRHEMAIGDRRRVPGMVRASLGVYSTAADIDALGQALEALLANRDEIQRRYQMAVDGTFVLKPEYGGLPPAYTLGDEVARWLSSAGAGAAGAAGVAVIRKA